MRWQLGVQPEGSQISLFSLSGLWRTLSLWGFLSFLLLLKWSVYASESAGVVGFRRLSRHRGVISCCFFSREVWGVTEVWKHADPAAADGWRVRRLRNPSRAAAASHVWSIKVVWKNEVNPLKVATQGFFSFWLFSSLISLREYKKKSLFWRALE